MRIQIFYKKLRNVLLTERNIYTYIIYIYRYLRDKWELRISWTLVVIGYLSFGHKIKKKLQ